MSDYLEDRRIVLSQGFYDFWKFAIFCLSQIADIIFEYNKNATLGKDKFQSQKSIKMLPDTINPLYKFQTNMEEYNTLVGVHSISQNEFTLRLSPGMRYAGYSNLEDMSLAKLIFQGYPLYIEATRHTEMLTRYTSTQYYMQPPIYKTLLNGCNNQEVRDFITSQYNFFSRIQRGNDMPVMELVGMDGKKMNWRRTKGKVVILMMYNDYTGDQKFCEKIFHLFGENKKDVIVLRISPGFDYQSWKDFNESYTDKGLHMFFTGEESAFRDRFLMIETRYDARYLIIGKDGKIFTNPGRRDVIKETDAALKEEAPPNEYLKALWSRILPGALMGMILTFIFYRIINRRRLAKHLLERKMAELEQKAIKAQLNPHFLFNCLNSIQNLIRTDRKGDADRYLSKFAVLIRQVLKNSEKEEISISEELKGLELYLGLEQMRFNFDYEILPDETIDIYNVMIPSMLIHPVVENAILHGLDPKEGDKKLIIRIKQSGGSIQFLIEDNGIGRKKESMRESSDESRGLKLMETRMEILRKNSHEEYNFKITDKKDQNGKATGTCVEILIPDER